MSAEANKRRSAAKKLASQDAALRARVLSFAGVDASKSVNFGVEIRACEAYLDRLRVARSEMVKKYADLPQLRDITALFDYELSKVARRLASLTMRKLDGQ